jgi:hypothetical protein
MTKQTNKQNGAGHGIVVTSAATQYLPYHIMFATGDLQMWFVEQIPAPARQTNTWRIISITRYHPIESRLRG